MNSPAQAGGPPPWIDPSMQAHVAWRDDDILIAVPPKSGTTWTMNIVHQLLSGGDADFADIYAEVPWIELVTRPGMPRQEMLERVAAMPRSRPRAFKTHGAPPVLPYIGADASPRVRYVVVMRNPEEALVSMKPFLEQHSDALFGSLADPARGHRARRFRRLTSRRWAPVSIADCSRFSPPGGRCDTRGTCCSCITTT
ncbi:MAG: sulfotransferase domain-containing protein [Proteobacteria bacterium]|nr:sulfotransferase domain-containing protein [Pseudomonadota bacterium]